MHLKSVEKYLLAAMLCCQGPAGAQLVDLEPTNDIFLALNTDNGPTGTIYEAAASFGGPLGGDALSISTVEVKKDASLILIKCVIYRYVGLTDSTIELIEEMANLQSTPTIGSAYFNKILARPTDDRALIGLLGELCASLISPWTDGSYLLGPEVKRRSTRLTLPLTSVTSLSGLPVQPRIEPYNRLILVYAP